jgi:hypothetical protein
MTFFDPCTKLCFKQIVLSLNYQRCFCTAASYFALTNSSNNVLSRVLLAAIAGIVFCILRKADLLIVYLPALNNVFKTRPFPPQWWPFVILGLPAGFFIPELEKFILRRLKKRRLTGNNY